LVTGYSRGIPAPSHLCDNALQIGYTLFRERVDEEIILKAIKHIEGPQRGIPNKLVTIVRELRLRTPGLGFSSGDFLSSFWPLFFPVVLK